MPIVCKPSLILPEHKVYRDEMIATLKQIAPLYPQWDVAEKMIHNSEVATRKFVRPLHEIIVHPGFEHRNNIYEKEAKRFGMQAATEALANAALTPKDIDMVIVVSCTGFMMPSLSAYLISEMGCKNTTKQLPFAQLGCVGGAAALNRAFDYTSLHRHANVLIVAVEFSSLCFQPSDQNISSFISDTLFGDAAAACVIKGTGTKGYEMQHTASFILENTERYIAFDVKGTGFHFVLDKQVMNTVEKMAPEIHHFIYNACGLNVMDLDFFLFHTGGRRILDELVRTLLIPECSVQHSRGSLRENGNIVSAAVFDVLQREFNAGNRKHGDKGMMVAFGPGFTTELNVGQWIT